jgi:hypothetical protein
VHNLYKRIYDNVHRFVFFSSLWWDETDVRPLGTSITIWSIIPTPDDDDDDCEAVGRMIIGRGNPKYSEETFPSVTLSTANPT